MGLNNLPSTVLLQIMSTLTQEQRHIVGSSPMTASALPLLDASKEELAQACSIDGKDRVLKGLSVLITKADNEHDQQLSLLWQLLQTRLTYLSIKGAEFDVMLMATQSIVETLFPDGMSQVSKSYLQEVSEAPIHFSNLTPTQHKTLESIVLEGDTALQITRRWLAAAETLGDLIRKRAIVEGADPSTFGSGDKSAIRISTISRLRFFLDMLPHSQLKPTMQATLSNPIMAAVSEYDKRQKRRAAANDMPEEEGDNGEVDENNEAPDEDNEAIDADITIECDEAPNEWAGMVHVPNDVMPLEQPAA